MRSPEREPCRSLDSVPYHSTVGRIRAAWGWFFGMPSYLVVIALAIWLLPWWLAVFISLPAILLVLALVISEVRRYLAKPS